MIQSIYSIIISSIKLLLVFFISVHLLNVLLYILAMGWWDGGLSFGFPKAFYVVNCGFGNIADCHAGYNFAGLVIDLLFWYALAIIVKTFRLITASKN